MKTLGFYLKPGAISAIMPDSLAEKAEIKVGFKLTAWEGQPIRDAFGLLMDVASRYGKTTNVTYEREDGSTGTFEWTVPERFPLTLTELSFAPVGLELPGSGLVYSVSNVISEVAPGTKAAASGLQPGDLIISSQILPTSDADKEFYKEVLDDAYSLKQPMSIDKVRNMHYLLTHVQLLKSGMPVELHFERNKKVQQCRVEVYVDSSIAWPDRGFEFVAISNNYKVDSVKDALVLGCSELTRRGGNVLEFLWLLVRGKLPLSALGGPGAIAVEANDAASKGISPLLMFLTMLSANLAIINFLPIPALDGGHMVFLTYEAIFGKPADEEFEARMRLAGVLCLLCLMGLVIFNDFVNISAWVRG
jgi:regulator of sigma E protease